MDIYYCSDIHLEFNKDFRLTKPNSDYATTLVLAGDLGNYQVFNDITSFLEDVKTKFDSVFYVLGNHEFYYTDLVRGYLDYERLCDEHDIILLENRDYIVNGLYFVGATYWSAIHPSKVDITYTLNDFKLITDMTLDVFNYRHIHSRQFFQESLMAHYDQPRIAITHHAPLLTGTSDPKYRNQTGFASQEPEIVALADHWIFGHTHYRNRFQFGQSWLYTNALGYPNELNEFTLEHFIV